MSVQPEAAADLDGDDQNSSLIGGGEGTGWPASVAILSVLAVPSLKMITCAALPVADGAQARPGLRLQHQQAVAGGERCGVIPVHPPYVLAQSATHREPHDHFDALGAAALHVFLDRKLRQPGGIGL